MSQLTKSPSIGHVPALRIFAQPVNNSSGPVSPPILTVRIGITGHRHLPGADPDRLSRAVDRVLQSVEKVVWKVARTAEAGYAADPPRLVAVSPLADGADRVCAWAARARGWELHVPIPFFQEEYEKDFTPSSRKEFRELLAQAARVLELDGSRRWSDVAYLRVGQVTLHQCEVLLAVWDGQPAAGIGGTAQIVDEAYECGIPVVWIHSAAPHRVRLLTAPPYEPSKGLPLEPALSRRLTKMLLPPSEPKAGRWKARLQPLLGTPEEWMGPRTYYAPVRRRIWHVPIYNWFRAAILGRAKIPKAAPGPTPPWADFSWADARANHHAQCYRSAFTATYLLGALAVFCALAYGFLLRLTHDHRSLALVWTELVLTVLATAIVVLAWWGRSHEIWLDARLLAERFRQLDILQRLGRSGRGARASAGKTGAPTEERWASWLFRAHARDIGMPNARLDEAYLRGYHAHLRKVLNGQREYHHANYVALRMLRERLHLVGLLLFAGTLAICILHVLTGTEAQELKEASLILLAGVLPAFAAAVAGIIGHGEFQRIARNSRETTRSLGALVARLENHANGTSRMYGQVAEDAAELMLSDLVAWHVLVSDRSVEVG